METPRPAHIDDRLDEALTESFPASDPPAVHSSDDPPRSAPRARRHVPQRKRADRRPSGAQKRKPQRPGRAMGKAKGRARSEAKRGKRRR